MKTVMNFALVALTTFYVLLCATGASSRDLVPAQGSGRTGGEAAEKQQERDPAIRDLRGEWQRLPGGAFACRVDTQKPLPLSGQIKPEDLARACLHMGPLVIGGEARTLGLIAPAPHRTLPRPNGTNALLYFLDGPERHPYLVATVVQDRIVALQVTGPTPSKGFGFNHVDLGASIETLMQYFGPPIHKKPSGQKDTDLWSYGVWPFTFEVKDARVTSIRIAEPGF